MCLYLCSSADASWILPVGPIGKEETLCQARSGLPFRRRAAAAAVPGPVIRPVLDTMFRSAKMIEFNISAGVNLMNESVAVRFDHVRLEVPGYMITGANVFWLSFVLADFWNKKSLF